MALKLTSLTPIKCEHGAESDSIITASVVYLKDCEACIRQGFEEKLQKALAELKDRQTARASEKYGVKP